MWLSSSVVYFFLSFLFSVSMCRALWSILEMQVQSPVNSLFLNHLKLVHLPNSNIPLWWSLNNLRGVELNTSFHFSSMGKTRDFSLNSGARNCHMGAIQSTAKSWIAQTMPKKPSVLRTRWISSRAAEFANQWKHWHAITTSMLASRRSMENNVNRITLWDKNCGVQKTYQYRRFLIFPFRSACCYS